ncbi:hypothetical protein EJB05_36977, partial [Eragrostis curvula]
MHNADLKQKLAGFDDILCCLTSRTSSTASSDPARTCQFTQFHRKFTPCCDSPDAQNGVGYFGKVDDKGTQQYSLCLNPANYSYWDFWHPTQAGWKAVMQVLEDPIKDFLGI